MTATPPSKQEIRQWLQDPSQWPNDSYDIESLQPSAVQERREAGLRPLLPAWCWTGQPGAAVLSIGAGKAYLERKYWGSFDKLYIIDPSEQTRLSLDYFPIHNAQYLGASLFSQGIHLGVVPRYAWLGASIHYLFGEFYGWEFMHKLAMMVSDTLIVDAGVFDPDTRHGAVFLESWKGQEAFEIYRRAQFSFAAFKQRIAGLWEVDAEWPTPWIDGRRTLVLRRCLPPPLQRPELGELQLVKTTPYWSVYRTSHGYFKQTADMTQLLAYDTVSKVMGWPDLLRWRVFDGEHYCGFVTRDLGDTMPTAPSVSERMHLSLLSWLLPLGLLPADVARQNLRMCKGQPIWMDIDVRSLGQIDARQAAWMVTNMYKQYDQMPTDTKGISHYIGRTPDSLVRPQWQPAPETEAESQWHELLEHIREIVSVAIPDGATVLVISKGDEDLMQLGGRRAWHFPRNVEGAYAGYHPASGAQAIEWLEQQRHLGAEYLLLPSTAFWWREHYQQFHNHLESLYHRLFADESCVIYRLAGSASTATHEN